MGRYSSSSSPLIFRIILLFLTVSDSSLGVVGLGVGINYGQIANNLPSPSRVAFLLRSLNVSRIKLYDADPNVLTAFSNAGVSFIVSIGNENLQNMRDPLKAQNWITQHLSPHLPQTKITSIVVGNEVFSSNDTQLMSFLLPAMQTVHSTLVNLGLDKQVAVTTAHSLTILSNSYPPSSGTFRQDFAQYLQPLLNFHAQIKSPFLINAYPYFAYKDNPNEVPLEYVLFQPNQGMTDPNTNLHYDNMLYAQLDAVYSAIRAMGHNDIEVRISETGWPSMGDSNEAGATPENAGLYNGNLLRRIEQRQGTPARPSVPVDIYVFALFNENLKPGPASERNYGLYYPDGNPVYDIGLQGYLPELALVTDSASVMNVSFSKALSIFKFLILLITYLICA
ncbi:glucan endo-1,3-beta-glucosidase 14 isoform X1 [Morus notabilis]|uniref:glucan endo-1,3-beta-glucosidase 14 isoform X1 n=1 Tax=Morus notabilis TaxID=981085 RepID=UPI000CED1343|nr:glucan endo-1,3-beta-glucosidase 14 isoform X1 [Morus notabilis]